MTFAESLAAPCAPVDGRLDVIVVVHGVGDPPRYAMLQHVANRCFGRDKRPQAVPIGFLHSQLEAGAPWVEIRDLPGLGFVEVYWADLARRHGDHALEDLGRWSKTIVERLRLHDERSQRPRDPSEYPAIRRVLHDIGRSVAVLRWLHLGLTKVHLGSLPLERILAGLMAELQLFAEFDLVRESVLGRFRAAVRRVAAHAAEVERQRGVKVQLHVVGHSLGSVVAFLGLLEAATERGAPAPWLPRVRSFATLGTPIETILLLWPRIFLPYESAPGDARARLPFAIPWHNYCELADPVGDRLIVTRSFVEAHVPGLFLDGSPFEHEFGRYPLPFKSHHDYWSDQALFDHWLDCLVRERSPCSMPPYDRKWARVASFLMPYAFSFVAALGVAHALGAWHDLTFARLLPVFRLPEVLALAALVYGTIFVGGAFRVTKRSSVVLPGIFAFAAGAFAVDRTLPAPLDLRLIAAAGALATLGVLSDWVGERSGFRRAFNFTLLIAAALALFVLTTWRIGAESLLPRALYLAGAVACWLLAILFFDFATVLTLYVRRGGHLAALARHWGQARPQ